MAARGWWSRWWGARSRFAAQRARPRIGIVTMYAYRKGITTQTRSIEAALCGRCEVFPVRKLSRLDRDLASTRSVSVAAGLRHDRVVAPRTSLTSWAAEQDVVIIVERAMPKLCEWLREAGTRSIVLPNLDWLSDDGRERCEALQRADAVVALTPDIAARLRADGVEAVYEVPANLPEPLPEVLPAPGGDLVLYFNIGVGGSLDRRNVPMVLRTFNELLPKHPEARLLVKMHPRGRKYYPDFGELHPRIEVVCEELSDEGMKAMQARAHATLFPTKFEGLGYPLLESLACGVPVIATGAPPMSEFIDHEQNGLHIAAEAHGMHGLQTKYEVSEEDFRRQVERVLGPGGRELLAAMRERAREGVERRQVAAQERWGEVIAAVQPVILNVGAGDDTLSGAINIDIRPRPGIDLVACATRLPFADASVDEVNAQDLIEHFPRVQVGEVLDEWVRVLKPGGRLRVQTPDLRGVIASLQRGRIDAERAVEWLYGGQDHPGNFHYTAFDEAMLRALLEARGIIDIERIRASVSRKNLCLVGRRRR